MIISVSDVHLGQEGYPEQDRQFLKFLDFIKDDALKYGGHLVLLGDIFDFWRTDSAKVIQKYSDVIKTLFDFSSYVDIHYVFGNHDLYMREIPEYFRTSPFKFFGPAADIREGQNFRFIHGYQLEVMANPYTKDMKLYESLAKELCYHPALTGQLAGSIWNAISSLVQPQGNYLKSILKEPQYRLNGKNEAADRITELAKSNGRHLLLGGPFDWLVFGHTHIPFIDPISRTINNGSWGRNPFIRGLWYLKIDGGFPELIEWKKV
jgi:UDP-2,3-diacylglucosamine pyrophosphatase LpxH